MVWGSRMLQSLILFDTLQFCLMFYLLLVEREKKKKKNGQGAFFPQWDIPSWLCCVGFSQLLGAITSCFKSQSLNFMCT
jgi:hypothetical protein